MNFALTQHPEAHASAAKRQRGEILQNGKTRVRPAIFNHNRSLRLPSLYRRTFLRPALDPQGAAPQSETPRSRPQSCRAPGWRPRHRGLKCLGKRRVKPITVSSLTTAAKRDKAGRRFRHVNCRPIRPVTNRRGLRQPPMPMTPLEAVLNGPAKFRSACPGGTAAQRGEHHTTSGRSSATVPRIVKPRSTMVRASATSVAAIAPRILTGLTSGLERERPFSPRFGRRAAGGRRGAVSSTSTSSRLVKSTDGRMTIRCRPPLSTTSTRPIVKPSIDAAIPRSPPYRRPRGQPLGHVVHAQQRHTPPTTTPCAHRSTTAPAAALRSMSSCTLDVLRLTPPGRRRRRAR